MKNKSNFKGCFSFGGMGGAGNSFQGRNHGET